MFSASQPQATGAVAGIPAAERRQFLSPRREPGVKNHKTRKECQRHDRSITRNVLNYGYVVPLALCMVS